MFACIFVPVEVILSGSATAIKSSVVPITQAFWITPLLISLFEVSVYVSGSSIAFAILRAVVGMLAAKLKVL